MAVFTAGGAFVSCSDENPWGNEEKGEGRINLSLTTRADVEKSIPTFNRSQGIAPDIPRVEEFQIKMERLDGTWSATYPSLADFKKVETFPTGSYNLTAFYGQEGDEGFGKCYYTGSELITVHQEHTTEVSVTASLANSLVSISYSPEFQDFFAGWGARLHCENHDYITLAQDETRPVYICPGSITLHLILTNHEGNEATIKLDGFVAQPRHQYDVKVSVNNDNEGYATLEIDFDDSLTTENITIPLDDVLFNVPNPTITPTGFLSDETIETLKGNPVSKSTMMSVEAPAELKEALLTIDSRSYTPPFGNEINLCAANDIAQGQIASAGIVAKGFFHNPGQMAMLDLTNFATKLPVGTHKVTLVAVDQFDRSSQPVCITFDVQDVILTATPSAHLLGSRQVEVAVDYNGFSPLEDLSFKVQDNLGQYVNAPIIQLEEQQTRSFEATKYICTLSLPGTERSSIPAIMYLKGEEASTFNIPVEFPEYTLVSDIFTNYAKIKVSTPATSNYALEDVTNALIINIQGPSANSITKTTDAKAGMITLHGLTPKSTYSAIHSITSDGDKTYKDFTTEAEAQIPNSDFSQLQQTINFSNVQIGGKYSVWPVDYTLKANIKVNEPTGWASLNQKTAWSGSSNMNTWFVVPSTLADNGSVLIRSVAYDHSGVTPKTSGGAGNTKYYCENAPASIANRCAGELFLGTYSFDGTEHRTDGISFTSRPSSLSFDFIYNPVNNETGVVTIKLVDAAGTVIAEKTRSINSSSVKESFTVELPTYPFGKKATKIQLCFKSSSANPVVTNVPSGSELNEHQTLGNKTNLTSYKALSTGSELTISNVVLHYDDPTLPANAPKRKTSKSKTRK